MDTYSRLAEKLDDAALGAPMSEELVRILEALFDRDEAGVALSLPFRPAPLGKLASATGRDEEELGEVLERMADKGLVYGSRSPKGDYYALLPVLPGMFELQFMDGGRGPAKTWLAHLYESYYKKTMSRGMARHKTSYARVLTVEREIPARMEIFPYEKVSSFIHEGQSFALTHCHCRHQKDLIGEGCAAPKDVCMIFGPFAVFAVERGFAREAARDDMLEALDRAEEHGLVHVADNVSDRINFLCNCCGCCCGFLRAATQVGKANVVAASRFVADLERSTCSECGTCVERCQVGALGASGGGPALDASRCLGCGSCVTTCPSGALSLKPREGYAPPLPTRAELDARVRGERRE